MAMKILTNEAHKNSDRDPDGISDRNSGRSADRNSGS